MHFNLSLGRALGGGLAAKPIVAWLDPFLRSTLADMLVWPNRIVVPLSYDPDFDYSVLEMRCVPPMAPSTLKPYTLNPGGPRTAGPPLLVGRCLASLGRRILQFRA